VSAVTQGPGPAPGPEPGPATDPAGPARGTARPRAHWADVACIGGIVLSGVWYLAVILVIPSLIGTHPVLLEALGGSLPAMLAAGAFARIGRVSLVLALAAPVIGLAAFDPVWWWAGRRYGDGVTRTLADRTPRTARGVQRGRRLFDHWGGWTLVFAYYLPVPNNVLYAAAGWAGFGFLRFAVLDLIGTMLRIVVDVGLGYALGRSAAGAAGLVSRYSIAVTVMLLAGWIILAWRRSRAGRASARPAAVDASWEPAGTAAAEVTAQMTAEVTAQVTAEVTAQVTAEVTAQVTAHLRPLVTGGTVPGLVYAVITPGGQATGQLTRSGSQPLGPHVMMEIGSVTKVFTALLLADMAERGEVGLDDPIARHLPAAVAQACPAATRITLRQLATHTSGLPRLPRNLFPMALRHPGDPYAGYSAEHLYRALRRAGSAAPAGYRYSNYGFGLLGHLLSRTAGRPYPDLIADRVTGPLGLAETGTDVPDGQAAATGHRGGRPAAHWHLDALAGAGALRSTASDLARFLTANLHPQATPIHSVIETIQRPQHSPAGVAEGVPATGLGWHLSERAGRPVLWHNGGTGGFSAMLALDRQAGCAVAAVATSAPTRSLPLDGAVLAALTGIASSGLVSTN
jgi:D-alanyl-D-alanine-carboxypeptidase/D-alanyl-D-alanine-endopeptidase